MVVVLKTQVAVLKYEVIFKIRGGNLKGKSRQEALYRRVYGSR